MTGSVNTPLCRGQCLGLCMDQFWRWISCRAGEGQGYQSWCEGHRRCSQSRLSPESEQSSGLGPRRRRVPLAEMCFPADKVLSGMGARKRCGLYLLGLLLCGRVISCKEMSHLLSGSFAAKSQSFWSGDTRWPTVDLYTLSFCDLILASCISVLGVLQNNNLNCLP